MNDPQKDDRTNDLQLYVFWDLISDAAETGDSAIISYGLEWDAGSNKASWFPVVGYSFDDIVLSFTVQSGLTQGNVYYFRLQAKNIYGWGEFSNEVDIAAAGVPDQAVAPVVTLTSGDETSVTITWVAPYDNSDPITSYHLQIRGADGNYFDVSECPTSLILTCDVPMTTLRASPFNLVFKSLVQAKVQARNTNDWGDMSEANTAGSTITTEPAKMGTPLRGANTSTTTMHVTWSSLLGDFTGGEPILSYDLQWDEGFGGELNWVDLVGEDGNESTSLSFQWTTDVLENTPYRLKVRAKNVHGWGAFSDVLLTYTTGIPGKPNPVTIAINNVYVRIAWVDPVTNYEAITNYKIVIAENDGSTYTELTQYCNGKDVQIANQKFCNVPLSVLFDTSYSYQLTAGTLIQAKVAAYNSNGMGEFSDPNTVGELLEMPPSQMLPPTRNALSNISQIVVDWLTLVAPENGYSPILSYNLQWDAGTTAAGGTITWSNLVGFNTDSLLLKFSVSTNVQAGVTYYFKVRARNHWGWGPFSLSTGVKAASAPLQPATVVTSIDPATGGIRIEWVPPYSNEQTITQYQVEIQKKDGSGWIDPTTDCVIKTATPSINKYCIIDMDLLIDASTWNYAFRDLIVVHVRALNVFNWSPYSTSNTAGAMVRVIPDSMNIPQVSAVATTGSQISVFWDPLVLGTRTGDSAITSYWLQWDKAMGTGTDWFDLVGYPIDSLATSFIVTTGVVGGDFFQFKLFAKNIYGTGPEGPIATFQAAEEPDEILNSDILTTNTGTDVVITWVAPFDNYNTIDDYEIQVRSIDGETFVVATADCDEDTNTLVATTTCTISMTTLRAPAYSLTQDKLVIATVKAHNDFGWGIDSQSSTGIAIIQTEPHQMAAPVYDATASSLTSIHVTLTALIGVKTGSSSITSYHVEYYDGTSWASISGQDGSLTTTLTAVQAGLTGGNTYKFRVQARNIFGWGPLSAEISVVSSRIPDKPDPVVVEIVSLDVKISWTLPIENFATVTKYEVVILQKDGSYTIQSAYCDATDIVIVTQLWCKVPEAVLRAAPFSLVYDDLMIAKVRAFNVNGWSVYSDPNTDDAVLEDNVQVEPIKMAAPTEGTLTDEFQVEVDWVALSLSTETRGSPVTSYHLKWDAGTGGLEWHDLAGFTADDLSLTYIVTAGVIPDKTYEFQVRAQNKWGWGQWSTISSIKASTWPSDVLEPVTSIDPSDGAVVVTWDEPDFHSDIITEYLIEIYDPVDLVWYDNYNCDGTDATVINTQTCSIPMVEFTNTYHYNLQDTIQVRVSAANNKGWTENPSPTSTAAATAKTIPAQMASNSLSRGDLTSETQIHVLWTPLTTPSETGDSAIVSYNLEWDKGVGDWEDLTGIPSDYLLHEFIVTTTVVKNTVYSFRIRASNIYGWQPLPSTPEVFITSSDKPSRVPSVSTSYDLGVDATMVKISWGVTYDNSDPITSFEVLIKQKDGTWSTELTDCDGSDATILGNLYCFVPLSTLRASPFSLVQNDIVVVKVRAENDFGYGDFAEPNVGGAKIQVEPWTVSKPTLDIGNSDKTTIAVVWAALTGDATGGSPITSYQVQWDDNTGSTWFDVKGQDGALDTLLTATKSSLTPGATYKFKVRARNVHGWSASYSAELSVIAAQEPDKPSAITTAYNGANIRISWTEPAINFATVTAYDIIIQDTDEAGNFIHELVSCDASTGTIVTNKHCDIPVKATLRVSPFDLELGQLLVAQVRAYNERGWSAWSDANTIGVTIQTEPISMSTPSRGIATDSTKIQVDWAALVSPQNGDSVITSYSLEWDAGTNSVSWAALVGQFSNYMSSTYTVTTSVVKGTRYNFRVRAKNKWGWGPYSSVANIQAATKPLQMAAVSTSVDAASGDLAISWIAPDNQGSAITEYTILISKKDGSSWDEYTTTCDGADPTKLSCKVPMIVLETTYGYALQDLILVKAFATNIFGDSTESLPITIGATLRTVPLQMTPVSRGEATCEDQIVVEWVAPVSPNTGDSGILSYNLVWDDATGTVDQDLAGDLADFLDLSFEIPDGVTTGQDYLFKLRAKNIYGWGPFSTIATIKPSSVPVEPEPVVTSVVGTKVRFEFTEPFDNGDAITSFNLLIRKKDGTYVEDITKCVLSWDAGNSVWFCEVETALLRASPYNLVFKDLVQAKVRANNAIGSSEYSQVNTAGAHVQVAPLPPTNLRIDKATSTLTTLDLEWNALTTLTETGGSPILNYKLTWN